MRSNLAILILLLSTASCASGGITPRAREVRALRGEVDRLNQRAEALQAQIAGLEGGYQSALEAREQVLRNELLQLQEQIGVLVTSMDGAEGQGPEGQELAAAGTVPAPAAADATRTKSARRKTEPKEAEVEEPDGEDDPSERVRALMADVASRLQVASESKGGDAQSAARLSRARQLLVDADKAASRREFEQAEKLAQDAAEVIADVVAGEGTAKAP